jgi:hypothetical protein
MPYPLGNMMNRFEIGSSARCYNFMAISPRLRSLAVYDSVDHQGLAVLFQGQGKGAVIAEAPEPEVAEIVRLHVWVSPEAGVLQRALVRR